MTAEHADARARLRDAECALDRMVISGRYLLTDAASHDALISACHDIAEAEQAERAFRLTAWEVALFELGRAQHARDRWVADQGSHLSLGIRRDTYANALASRERRLADCRAEVERLEAEREGEMAQRRDG